MTEPAKSRKEGDVVDLLVRQHREIERLFGEVEQGRGEEREETFDRLRRMLSVHETAEESFVHPGARRALEDGDRVIGARLSEENRAKRMLSSLDRMSCDAPEFLPRLIELRDAVLTHAEREEQEEFPALRARTGEQRLGIMATAVRAAEALAPTRPHPGVESPVANLLTGPFMAVVDRTRDAVRRSAARRH